MHVKKIIILLLIITAITACRIPFRGLYSFKFVNNSEKSLYIILDLESSDNQITVNSSVWHAPAFDWIYVDSLKPWSEIVKDNICLYVIDASGVNLDEERSHISQEAIEQISPDMILSQIILTPNDFPTGRIPEVFYPQP